MTPDDFPLFMQALGTLGKQRRVEWVQQAIVILNDGLDAGSIRNVALNEAKDTLNRAVGEAFDTYSAVYSEQTPLVQEGLWIKPYSMHEVPSGIKKLEAVMKKGAEHPVLTQRLALLRELLPLHAALATLKTKVVKGRAPKAESDLPPPNPDKVVGTCGWCQRKIAVDGAGQMVLHGYERPGTGETVGRCPATSRYRALEISDEALRARLAWSKTMLARAKNALDKLPQATTLPHPWTMRREVVTPGDKLWERAMEVAKHQLEREVRDYEHDSKTLEKAIAEWKPAKLYRADGKEATNLNVATPNTP